jgi:hypothetical protein
MKTRWGKISAGGISKTLQKEKEVVGENVRRKSSALLAARPPHHTTHITYKQKTRRYCGAGDVLVYNLTVKCIQHNHITLSYTHIITMCFFT